MNGTLVRGLVLIALALIVATCVSAWRATHPTPGQIERLNAQESYPYAEQTACYQRAMGLGAWMLEIQILHDTADVRYAHTSWNLVRQSAITTYNLAYTTPQNARELVVHELAHLLTAELYWLAANTSGPAAQLAGERTADAISRWPIWGRLCPDREGAR